MHRDFPATWPRAWRYHKANRIPEKGRNTLAVNLWLFYLNSSYGFGAQSVYDSLRWQTKDLCKLTSLFSLRSFVAFPFVSLTFAFDLGDSLYRGIWSKSFKLMALSYSLGVNLQETNSSRLDHVLPYLGCIMTPPLSVSATLFLLSQRKLREKLRKFSSISINGRDSMRKNNQWILMPW